MTYIDTEVREVCISKQWQQQIRRKWTVREKPVSASAIDDYEWKLIPTLEPTTPPQPDIAEYFGTYYVLNLERLNARFVLQHDTFRVGIVGPAWEVTTYSYIQIGAISEETPTRLRIPQRGWLRDHVRTLTDRFGPNQFSAT